MSAERIQRLHEKASERYLQGDYPAALAAWQEVLQLDPGDAQALDGVRMAKSLSGDGGIDLEAEVRSVATPSAIADFSLEDEIDDGLAVLGASPAPVRAAEAGRHSDRQNDGIDFGDVTNVAAIPLARDGAGVPAAQATAATPAEPSWSSHEQNADLLDVDEPAAPADSASSVAEEALRHRVLDLLDEARECRDQGEIEAALGVISRIYILDEANEAARALEAELRAPGDNEMQEVEGWIAEGVQAFDAGRLEESAELFNKALERSPSHREAIQYLDAIAARDIARGGSSDNLLGDTDLLGDMPMDGSIETVRSTSPATALVDDLERSMGMHATVPAGSAELLDEIPVPTARRSIPKWLIPGAIGLVVVLGIVALAISWMSAPPNDNAGAPAAKSAQRAKATRPTPKQTEAPAASTTVAASLDAALQRARVAMAAADYSAAVVAYNEALAAKPGDPEATAGLLQAGELYRAWKAEQEQIDSIRVSFRDGEYTAALRALYRLPEGYDRARVDRWKINGWFNLAVVALRAGDAVQALSHLDEALAISSNEDVSKLRTFAQRYRNRPKDRAFYAAAEAIPFRPFD